MCIRDSYYVVLSYVDVNGKRHRPWISTGLPQKGNKKRAEAELARIRSTYEPVSYTHLEMYI